MKQLWIALALSGACLMASAQTAPSQPVTPPAQPALKPLPITPPPAPSLQPPPITPPAAPTMTSPVTPPAQPSLQAPAAPPGMARVKPNQAERQQKRAACTQQATGKTGEERKTFIRMCMGK